MEENTIVVEKDENKKPQHSKKDRNTLIIIATVATLTISAITLALVFGFKDSAEQHYAWYNAKPGLYDSDGKYIEGSISTFAFGNSEKGKSLLSINNSYENASVAYLPSGVSSDGVEKKLDTIGDGKTSVLQGEFNLEKIYVNRSVTKVLSFSFANSSSLTTYSHGSEKDAPLEFGEKVFYCDDKLEDVYLPNNTTSIGKSMFEGCLSLKKLDLSNTGINAIPESAFASTSSLNKLALSKNIYSIGDKAFYQSGIETFVGSQNLESIGENAFDGASVKEINLSSSKVAVIKSETFKNTSKLNKLTISNRIKRINNHAFSASSLTTINFGGTSEMWDEIEKDDGWNEGSSLDSIICSDKTIDLN